MNQQLGGTLYFAITLASVFACGVRPADAALTGALSDITPESVDLTAEGTLDWAIWGVGDAGSPAQLEASSRKDSGDGTAVGLISDPLDLNGLEVGDPLYTCGGCQAIQDLTSFDWTDGVPVASATGASGDLLFRRQGEGGGFSLSVPAAAETHRLKIYVSAYRATGRFTATLSDNSGGYFDTSLTQSSGFIDELGVYTLEYSSLVPDTMLEISFSVFEDRGTFENVGLMAATLEALTLPPTLDGDYTGDGLVDAADYTLWRDTFGETGEELAADGDNDQVIGTGDYDIWAQNYGATPTDSSQIPEPATAGLAIGTLLVAGGRTARRGTRS